jgi:hypothetical protein
MRAFVPYFAAASLLLLTAGNAAAQIPPVMDLPPYKTSKCFLNLGTVPSPVLAPIPVGCDAVDCCPNCQAGAIDWVIRASGMENVSLTLKFEGLDEGVAQRLASDGNAWLAPDVLKVRNGMVRIDGIGRSTDSHASVGSLAVARVNQRAVRPHLAGYAQALLEALSKVEWRERRGDTLRGRGGAAH